MVPSLARAVVLVCLARSAAQIGDDGLEPVLVVAGSNLACSSLEYYSTISLACESCASMSADASSVLVADSDSADANGNALRCRCPVGYVRSSTAALCDADGACASVRCTACSGGNTSFSDNSQCVRCPSGLDATGDCLCSGSNSILVERDEGGARLATKVCVACVGGRFAKAGGGLVAGAYYAGDRYACRSCPDPRMAWSSSAGACVCVAPYEIVGRSSVGAQSCVDASKKGVALAAYPEQRATRVNYDQVQASASGRASGSYSVVSASFEHYYANASTLCTFHDGTPTADAACHTLANLCVLTQYELASSVCALYVSLQAQRARRNAWGAHAALPWLFYDRPASTVREDSGLEMTTSFKGGNDLDHLLQLRAAVYSLNGTLLRVERFDTQPFYCARDAPRTEDGGGASRSTLWQRYGYSFRDRFACSLPTLVTSEQLFYDLYIVDSRAECASVGADDAQLGGECLYPVPVLNRGLRSASGSRVNSKRLTSERSDDVFVRRFALFDAQSGVEDASGAVYAVRFAASIVLRVEGRPNHPTKLFAPVLELSYKERRRLDWLSRKQMRTFAVDFQAEYSASAKRFWRVGEGFLIAFVVLAGAVWLYALRGWYAERYPPDASSGQFVGPSPFVLANALALFARCFVHVLFPLLFGLCAYYFVFFKLQENVHTMLPAENVHDGAEYNYYPVQTLLVTLWALSSAHVLNMIYLQCTQQVFFIDWERPRTFTDANNAGRSFPVSAWRTVFVANEWSELCTARHTSVHFILVWLWWFLVGMGLENNATPQPDLDDLSPQPHNAMLRFANTTFWWLALAAVQFAWNFLLYERYVSEPQAQSFVDVCSVAKISVWVLDSEAHGYYIHGDSPYPHADETMEQLTKNLQSDGGRDIAGLGLEPSLPGVTTFETWLTPVFRKAWEAVRLKVYSARLAEVATGARRDAEPSVAPRDGHKPRRRESADRRPALGAAMLGRRRDALFTDSSSSVSFLRDRTRHAEATEKISSFLRTFLTHGYQEKFGLNWVSREPSVADRLTRRLPLTGDPNGPVVMQPDKAWFGGDYGWTQTGFLGHDWELLTHEILTYSVCDLWFGNTSLSILLTFLSHHALRALRSYYGESNLASQTHVDARFLI